MSEDQNRTLNDKFMLRLPDGMRDRIKAAASVNNRSMNAEILAVLEEKFPSPALLAMEEISLLVREVTELLKRSDTNEMSPELVKSAEQLRELLDTPTDQLAKRYYKAGIDDPDP